MLRVLDLKAALGLHDATSRPTGALSRASDHIIAEAALRRALTLVKDTQGLLPISPERRPRVPTSIVTLVALFGLKPYNRPHRSAPAEGSAPDGKAKHHFPVHDMSIGPILLSLALFAFWAALGWSVLALAEPAMPSLQSFLLAPVVGVSVTLLPVYWLSVAGVPVAVIARPLLALYGLVAIAAWSWRRPPWSLSELIFLLPIIAAIVIFGFPALWFGLDWVGNANDDWGNYNLSAMRFLHDGYYQQPSIEAMRSGLYYPGFLWFLSVAAAARSGSDLLLAWVAGAVGNNPFFVFMPVILALHGVFACSAAALAMTSLSRRVLFAAVVLLAIAPLNLYAVHQQLIAQVAGLGLMCALGTLTLVAPREFDNNGRIALIAVVAAAYLLTYPETVFIFGIALVLYHARRAADVSLEWKSFRRLLIAPLASCILLGPYGVGCLFFLFSQIHHSAIQGIYDGTSLFPYFLVPNGVAALFGISRLGEMLIEPWLSLSIVMGLSLLAITCFAMVVGVARGRPVSYHLAATCGVAAVVIAQHNDFGLFKAALFSQAFIWFVLVAALSSAATRLSAAVYMAVLAMIGFTDFKYVKAAVADDVGSASLMAHASQDHLLTRLLQDPPADQCGADFASPNPSLIKLLGARVDCARSFIARPIGFLKLLSADSDLIDRNPLRELLGIARFMHLAAPRLEGDRLQLSFPRAGLPPISVTTRKPVIEFSKLGEDGSSDSIYGTRRQASTMPAAPEDQSNKLIFIGSNLGEYYHLPEFGAISLYATQHDFFYPEGEMAAVGRYLLFRINAPAKLGRLIMDLTTTILGDGCACLPPVSVAGDEQVPLGVLGHGAARVMSPAFSPKIVDGVAYLLIDLGADARRYETPRTGLMRLYGTDVPIDIRKMVAYVRQIRFVDASSEDKATPPSKIAAFPSDLANAGLEFSGIYEDGWTGDQGFMTLHAESAGNVVMRGTFPAGIGLDEVQVALTVGSAQPVLQTLKPGPFVVTAPVAAGSSRIGFRFSNVGRLPSPDGRPAVVRLASVAIETGLDRPTAPSSLPDDAPSTAAGLPKFLGDAAKQASGIFSDGWIAPAGNIVVDLCGATQVTLRGMVPGGIGLDDQEITIGGDVSPPIRRKLAPRDFQIEIPVSEGRSTISLAFSEAAALPNGDGRHVAALLRSVSTDPSPPLSLRCLQHSARKWLAAVSNWF